MSKTQPKGATASRGLKRKLADTFDSVAPPVGSPQSIQALITALKQQHGRDRVVLRRVAHQLAELCKQGTFAFKFGFLLPDFIRRDSIAVEDFIDNVVNEGAIEAVVPLLTPTAAGEKPSMRWVPEISPFFHKPIQIYVQCHVRLRLSSDPLSNGTSEDVEKEACFILGLLAVKPEYQSRIAFCGALDGLVRLLKEHNLTSTTKTQPGSGGAARRAADAITNLAHENSDIKNMVREKVSQSLCIADLLGDQSSACYLKSLNLNFMSSKSYPCHTVHRVASLHWCLFSRRWTSKCSEQQQAHSGRLPSKMRTTRTRS